MSAIEISEGPGSSTAKVCSSTSPPENGTGDSHDPRHIDLELVPDLVQHLTQQLNENMAMTKAEKARCLRQRAECFLRVGTHLKDDNVKACRGLLKCFVIRILHLVAAVFIYLGRL